MLLRRLSGEKPRNKGRRVGRQMAMMPTPSSTMPQKSKRETTPMSSVARRPATLAFARTVVVVSGTVVGKYGDDDDDDGMGTYAEEPRPG